MENILEVKKLKISFRTPGGILKAVRNISFSLEKGRTLAIVGESGSGKSVTSKAIMGILAGNAIVEGGEILYDGKDLLKISEEEMCKIRGDDISMIFQDPLSSLNPIVKIGNQITEAMLLKNKTSRKAAKKEFKTLMEILCKSMEAATGNGANAKILCDTFEKSCMKAAADGGKASLILSESQEMREFAGMAQKGLTWSFEESLKAKKNLMRELSLAKEYYAGDFSQKEATEYAKKLTEKVSASIDRLEIHKESAAYTFGSSLQGAIDTYFYYQKNNPKEEARFASQTRKREALIARGKQVDWKVVPKNVLDLDEMKENMISVIERLETVYGEDIARGDAVEQESRCRELLEYLQDRAARSVYQVSKSMAKEKALELMKEVGIPEPEKRYYQYPFEFSGGMRQRIVIAIALAADPQILICDEPTTALDVTIQSQILELINDLKEERGLSVIFITHDLGVVANVADDIAVMYAGKIVEEGTVDEIFYDPRHPYTWALLSSMPDLDTKEKLDAIPGTPPNLIYPPEGDAFAERNKYAMQIDFEKQPPMFPVSETHRAATWLLHPDAPKVEIPKIITDRIERMKARDLSSPSAKKINAKAGEAL